MSYTNNRTTSRKPANAVKQTTVTLDFNIFNSTIELVSSTWKQSKLFSTKQDKQTMLIINSTSTYRVIISTRYVVPDRDIPVLLEDVYGTGFTRDVVSAVMQELLLGA